MSIKLDFVRSSDYKHDYHILGELILEELSPLQRILFIADGTLTKLLEVLLNERMQVVKLFEKVLSAPRSIEALELEAGQKIIERKVLLQGKLSGQNWLYADSMIALDRLDKSFQDKLLNFHIPIGKLWMEYKIETYKELITARREPADELGVYFQMEPEEVLLSRTYRVFYRGTPTMMITEKFPEHYFKSQLC